MKETIGNLAKQRSTEVRERSNINRPFTRNRWLAALMLVGPAYGQQIVVQKTGESRVYRICVEYYNYARAPNSVITEGLSITDDIFRQAGVQMLWKEVQLDSKDSDRPCDDLPTFCLRILPRAMSNRAEQRYEALGSAVATDDNTGVVANVFYQRLEGLPVSVACSRAKILGHIIAHELGHLLLGRNSHSESGIMSANWQRDRQIAQLRAQSLFFSRDEAERIRHNILERERSR